jgi:hypothetical protein
MEYVPAPDFPTGALILGRSGARKAYHEGRGSVDHPLAHDDRGEPRRTARHRRLRDPLPGEQGDDDRAHRRARPREADRGHRPRPGRERPAGRAGGHRAQARRDARRGPEPALPLHADADLLRLQHAGAERRAAGAARPQEVPLRVRAVPRGGRGAADGARAAPRAGAGASALRPRRRGVERRRGGGDDPVVGRCRRGAGAAHGPGLARRGHRALHRADRRPLAPGAARTGPISCPRPRPARSSTCGCSA